MVKVQTSKRKNQIKRYIKLVERLVVQAGA